MFTIVICSKEFHDGCTKTYREFLAPLFKDSDFAFCCWNPLANSMDEALPGLKRLLEGKHEWRALVVLDRESYGEENIAKRNPYNYIDATSTLQELRSAEEVYAFRKQCEDGLQRAIQNPLMKLGMWLAGAPSTEYPAMPAEYATLPQPEEEGYFDELRARHLSAAEVELDRLTELRGRVLSQHFVLEGHMQQKPVQIVTLCERMHINDNAACNAAWRVSQEHAYSRFFEDNMYADRMRCLLTDVDYVDSRRVESSYFNFLSLAMMLARQDMSGSVLRQGRLYSVGIRLNRRRLSECYYTYLSRLNATLRLIGTYKRRHLSRQSEPLTNRQADELFISDVIVPVEISNEFDREALLCEHKDIGLSGDCPRDEAAYWDDQYRSIEKKFIRYLREPRRAVKTSVSEDFRPQNRIDDDRAGGLNEFQLEEVAIRLADEEEAMVKTGTIRLFKTKEYLEAIEEADKEVKKGIAQRMTKKKTVLVGLIAAAVYLVGFLPLLFGNTNTVKSFLFSLLLTGVTLFLFLIVGLVYLFVLRHRLVNRLKHFNYVMYGLLAEIDDGLHGFSQYLSHCCNVMREFSVLSWFDMTRHKQTSILKKHEYLVMQQLNKAQSIFSGNIDTSMSVVSQMEPFDYDYSQDKPYSFEFDTVIRPGVCEFFHPDEVVDTPVDYIEAITLAREELYD